MSETPPKTFDSLDSVEESEVAESLLNKWPRGTVVRYLTQSRYGFVKGQNGKDIYFNLDEVRFFGEKNHRHLEEGVELGYDVGWTSHGLHVVKMKLY